MPLKLALVLILVAAMSVRPADGATSSTAVSVSVPSATSLSTAACATGSAATSFGTVLPGSSATTTSPCRLVFGSSNDTSMLRLYQADGGGSAMWSSTDGTLDTAFNGTGMWRGTNYGQSRDFALAADGSTVSVGAVVNDCNTGSSLITRVTSAGTLDGTFGTGGVTTVDTDPATMDGFTAVAIAPSGTVSVGGFTNANVCATASRAIVGRFLGNGTLDPAFGTGGTTITSSLSPPRSIVIQPDGKLLTGGASYTGGTAYVARYTTAGVLDSTFGTAGIATLSPLLNSNAVQRIALRPDGTILAAGFGSNGTNYGGFVARLLANGTLDNSFGTNGISTLSFGTSDTRLTGLAVDSLDRIVLGGTAYTAGAWQDAIAARLTSSGALDGTFGTAGVAWRGVQVVSVTDVAVQADDSVVVYGNRVPAPYDLVFVLLLDPSGAPVTAPALGSAWESSFNGSCAASQNATSIHTWRDGSLVLGAYCGNSHFYVLRLRGTTIPDFESAVTDWTTGAGMFGACLEALGSGAGTSAGPTPAGTWQSTTCATPGGSWNALAPLPASGTSKVAQASALSGAAWVDLRFGLRVPLAQKPGRYTAKIAVEVVAPNA